VIQHAGRTIEGDDRIDAGGTTLLSTEVGTRDIGDWKEDVVPLHRLILELENSTVCRDGSGAGDWGARGGGERGTPQKNPPPVGGAPPPFFGPPPLSVARYSGNPGGIGQRTAIKLI